MKAAVLKKNGPAGQAFDLCEMPDPVPGKEQVLIESEAFGLNFADVMARKGLYRDAPPLPSVLGYEVVGRVVALGQQAPDSLLNKRVVAFTRFGGYGQRVITGANACIVIDENAEAAMMLALATQYCTAYYASSVATTVMKNDIVLQHAAAGGVGTALTQLCLRRGARVIGLTSSEAKKGHIAAQGCETVINYTQQDYAEEIRKKYGYVDVSFNSVAGSTFKKDLRLLNKGGRLVCYGAAERLKGKLGFLSTIGLVLRMGRIVPVKLLMQSQSLVGVNMLRIADHRPDVLQYCMERVVDMYNNREVQPHIGVIYPVERLAEAHAFFESGKSTGKLVVRW